MSAADFSRIHKAAKQVWRTLEADGKKHRWRWNLRDAKPEREKKPPNPDNIVERDGKWIVKYTNKTDEEIILRHDVPQRICQEWVEAKKNLWSKKKFEEEFLKGKEDLRLTGIDRKYLRLVLEAIVDTEQEQRPPAKAPILRSPPVEWAKDLRAKAVWSSQKRSLPALNEDVLERVNEFIAIVNDAKNIVILEGAGVSVAAGIPDFRSNKGLFKKYGTFIFEEATFQWQENEKKHHQAMGDIATMARKASHSPTPWSILKAFLAEVEYCRPLQRIFTLNIDGLDLSFKYLNTGRNGQAFPPAKSNPLVCYLHGNLRFTRCPKCSNYELLLPERHLDFTDLRCTKCILDSKGHRFADPPSIRPWVILYGNTTEETDPNSVEKARLIRWDRGDNDLPSLEELDSSSEQEHRPKRRKVQVKKSTQSKKPKTKKPVLSPLPTTTPPPYEFKLPDTLFVVGTSAKLVEIDNIVEGHTKGILERGGKVVWINLKPPPTKIKGCFTHIFAGPQVGDC